MSRKLRSLVAAYCAVLCGLPQASLAEEAQKAGAAARLLEEVMVTARKRSERLQDVPAAVTAIDGEVLRDVGAAGLDDFVRMVPGLNLGDTGLYGFKNFRIRGVATGTGASVLQAPVSIYFDEIQTVDPYVPQGTADFYLTDIERVEVLRGPQGTLYGSGSLSGNVRIITRKPELGVFAGSVEATYETVTDGGNGGALEAMLNLPLGERFAARIVAYGRDIPGWVDNIFTGKEDVNSGESKGARLALKGAFTEDFVVTALFAHQRDEFDDSPRTFVDGGEGGSREWSTLTSDKRSGHVTTASVVADWDLGPVALTSSSSYYKFYAEPRGGFDYLSATLGLPGTPMWQDLVSDNKSLFQEFRLQSQTSGPVSYIVGLHYSDRDIDLSGLIRNPIAEGVFGLPNLLDTVLDANVTEVALFGEVAVRLRPDLELAVGLRAFRNEFESQQVSQGLFTGFARVEQGGRNVEKDVSPRVTLTWTPTEDLTVYAQAAKGYRIGQVNSTLDAVLGTVPRVFDPDQLWNYELGTKGSFMNGRGQASAAVFYIDWQDIQVQLPGPSLPYTDNAGAARIVGLETELSYLLTDHLEIQNSIAITNAELAEDAPNLKQPSGVIGAYEGDPLPGSPDLTVSTALQYRRELSTGSSFNLRLDHQYVGGSRNSFSAVGSDKFGDYHVLNASAGYEFGSGFGLRLYVRNLGDDDGATNVMFGVPSFGYPAQALRLQPRTIGLSLRKEF